MATEGVTLEAATLERYDRFSLFNSPYPAHDRGCAIDLYPGDDVAQSPIAGTVLETKTVRAPPRPFAPTHDHLLCVACTAPASVAGLVARVLHVDPDVTAGDQVRIGDRLGTLVRAGFFAPWVDTHLHVGFRRPAQNRYRASGSLPIELDSELAVTPLEWDATGTVVETGATYAILDSPVHPNPGADEFVGVAADGGGVLDGGIPHYDSGGLLEGPDGPVSLAGRRLGVATDRTVGWDDVTVTANGEPVTGLSLRCARDAAFGAKIVCPAGDLSVGERVSIEIVETDRGQT